MIPTLTPSQQTLLRRCDGGLRLWEVGAKRAALLADLSVLTHLRFVSFDDDLGYELTAEGEAWLIDASR